MQQKDREIFWQCISLLSNGDNPLLVRPKERKRNKQSYEIAKHNGKKLQIKRKKNQMNTPILRGYPRWEKATGRGEEIHYSQKFKILKRSSNNNHPKKTEKP